MNEIVLFIHQAAYHRDETKHIMVYNGVEIYSWEIKELMLHNFTIWLY